MENFKTGIHSLLTCRVEAGVIIVMRELSAPPRLSVDPSTQITIPTMLFAPSTKLSYILRVMFKARPTKFKQQVDDRLKICSLNSTNTTFKI